MKKDDGDEEELSRRFAMLAGSPRPGRACVVVDARAGSTAAAVTSSCLCPPCARHSARRARPCCSASSAACAGGFLFLFARELGGGRGRGLRLAALLFGLGGLARLLGLGARRRPAPRARPARCLTVGIVGSRLGAELVQDVLPGLLRRLLAVGEAGFLESTHKKGLVAFMLWVAAARDGRFAASLSEPGAKCQRRKREQSRGDLREQQMGRRSC